MSILGCRGGSKVLTTSINEKGDLPCTVGGLGYLLLGALFQRLFQQLVDRLVNGLSEDEQLVVVGAIHRTGIGCLAASSYHSPNDRPSYRSLK